MAQSSYLQNEQYQIKSERKNYAIFINKTEFTNGNKKLLFFIYFIFSPLLNLQFFED